MRSIEESVAEAERIWAAKAQEYSNGKIPGNRIEQFTRDILSQMPGEMEFEVVRKLGLKHMDLSSLPPPLEGATVPKTLPEEPDSPMTRSGSGIVKKILFRVARKFRNIIPSSESDAAIKEIREQTPNFSTQDILHIAKAFGIELFADDINTRPKGKDDTKGESKMSKLGRLTEIAKGSMLLDRPEIKFTFLDGTCQLVPHGKTVATVAEPKKGHKGNLSSMITNTVSSLRTVYRWFKGEENDRKTFKRQLERGFPHVSLLKKVLDAGVNSWEELEVVTGSSQTEVLKEPPRAKKRKPRARKSEVTKAVVVRAKAVAASRTGSVVSAPAARLADDFLRMFEGLANFLTDEHEKDLAALRTLAERLTLRFGGRGK